MTQDNSPNLLLTTLQRAHSAFLSLGNVNGTERSRGISAMAKALSQSFDRILEANTLDLEVSREMAVSDDLLDWLKLTPERLETTVELL